LLPNRRSPNTYAAKQRFEETERLLNSFRRVIEIPNGTSATIAQSPLEVYVVAGRADVPWSAAVMKPPRLRFDAAIPSRSEARAFQGLHAFGAYSLEGFARPNILLAYPSADHAEAECFGNKLIRGSGNYPGFQKLFGIPDELAPRVENLRLPSGVEIRNVQRLRAALNQWAAGAHPHGEPSLAIVIVPHTDRWNIDTPYYTAKQFFAARGTPSQMVTLELLHDTGRMTWSLANIALAAFAKLGGVPWVVDAGEHSGDLVLGVGRANVQQAGGGRHRIFGYAVAFVANGAYISTHSFPPAGDEDEYEHRLKDAIVAALNETREWDEEPRRIVIHLAKRTGRREIQAAEANDSGDWTLDRDYPKGRSPLAQFPRLAVVGRVVPALGRLEVFELQND
jgi:hypothetical protein